MLGATVFNKWRAMHKPCSERDRLKEAYFQATLEAAALNGVSVFSKVFPKTFFQKLTDPHDSALAYNHPRCDLTNPLGTG